MLHGKRRHIMKGNGNSAATQNAKKNARCVYAYAASHAKSAQHHHQPRTQREGHKENEMAVCSNVTPRRVRRQPSSDLRQVLSPSRAAQNFLLQRSRVRVRTPKALRAAANNAQCA